MSKMISKEATNSSKSPEVQNPNVVFLEPNNQTTNFTAEDLRLYLCLCEVLRKRGLPLQAQYTTADTARIFDCDIRVIQDRIHSGKWPARDLPKRGRFLSCDLEAFLQMPLAANTTAEAPKGGRK